MCSLLRRAGWSVLRRCGEARGPRVVQKVSWCRVRHLSEGRHTTSLVRVSYFDQVEQRTKDSYLEMVNIYKNKERLRRGHVEFIYSALSHMKEFGVEKDLEVYKALVDVFPKGKMIPRNIFQVEFMHYPKHQQCAIDLLEQMEENGVMPDWDMETQLLNVFGTKGYPLRRYWRMMYWLPKWKNASPFPLPRPLPSDNLLLARLAIERIMGVDPNSHVTVFKTSSVEDSVDDTWIVSGQSPDQASLLEDLPPDSTLFVEGEFKIWLRNVPLSYFVLKTDPPLHRPKTEQESSQEEEDIKVRNVWSHPGLVVREKSVHEQEDGTLLAVCATGTSSRDSLLSWLRCLQASNPRLLSLPVLFRLAPSPLTRDEEGVPSLDQPTPSLPPRPHP